MRSNRGFTLIEVMIVVAIIAILASVAMSSYSDYVMRAKITDATAGLSDLRVRMEQSFQDNRSFLNLAGPIPTPNTRCGAVLPVSRSTDNFSFSCVATATTYTITATGQNAMAGFSYTVDESNVRQTTGAHTGWATSASCWVTTKAGPC